MIEQIPKHLLPERNPGAYPPGRACSCGAILNTSNPGPSCHPCQLASMPAEERMAEVIDISPDWAA